LEYLIAATGSTLPGSSEAMAGLGIDNEDRSVYEDEPWKLEASNQTTSQMD
jgi:hypothetical protein